MDYRDIELLKLNPMLKPILHVLKRTFVLNDSQVIAELPLLPQQRVETFLSDTMAAIESTGKFGSSSTQSSANKK